MVEMEAARQSVSVRLATVDDLASLLTLEQYWPCACLAATECDLRTRLANHPAGQFVATRDGGALVAVLYTQRVRSVDVLRCTNREAESNLHTLNGRVLHLLGVLQRSDAAGVGARLRDHALQLAREDASVDHVCAITRCRNWMDREVSGGVSYEDHVSAGTDTGLVFHTSAGARLDGIVPSYRPADAANLGHGVLVCYNVQSSDGIDGSGDLRQQCIGSMSSSAWLPPPTSLRACEALVCNALREMHVGHVRGRSFDAASMGRIGFMDLGLDSLDATTLAQKLNAKIGRAVDLHRTGNRLRRPAARAQPETPSRLPIPRARPPVHACVCAHAHGAVSHALFPLRV